MIERERPYCRIVDGHRLPGSFSEEVYRSGLRYQPEEGDVVLDTFPKCGTHWVVGILKAAYQVCRGVTPGSVFLEKLGMEAIENCPRPRIVFTHLPFHLVPFSSAAKYIYVIRNPKDCCVSFYHHTKTIPAYKFQDGTFDEYFEIFLDGRTDFGNYYESLRSWYAKRDEPNVLFLTYEGMHDDVRGSVFKITRFVDGAIADELARNEDKMRAVLEKSSVDSMKKDYDVQFVRKGTVGDWKNYFTTEQSRRLEERFISEMAGIDLLKLWDSKVWLLDEK
ncbi:sulfotransferase ssu-1-like isoform X1 [Haemaphysalis longicornis]